MTRKDRKGFRAVLLLTTTLVLCACAAPPDDGPWTRTPIRLEVDAAACTVSPDGGNIRIKVPVNATQPIFWASKTGTFSIEFKELPNHNGKFGEKLGNGGQSSDDEQEQRFKALIRAESESGTYAAKYTVTCGGGKSYDPVVIVDR